MRSPRCVRTVAGVFAGAMLLLVVQTRAQTGTPTGSARHSQPQANASTHESPAAPASDVWFPDLRGIDFRLDRPPVRVAESSAAPIIVIKEQPLIPLPPAAWTGLTGLATAGIFGSIKTLRRFVLR